MTTQIEQASPSSVDLDELARRDEEQYVHEVYETIASHFSSTRYKPWPGITRFFESLPIGALGVDAGCGNGKYLGLRSALLSASTRQDPASASQPGRSRKGKERASEQEAESAREQVSAKEGRRCGPIATIGVDRSSNLVGIAKQRSHEVLVGDAIDLPWRESAFDFAISIATIHHFTTPSRRQEAVRTMLRAINKRNGRLFIQVWAQEQSLPGNNNYETQAEGDSPQEQSKPLLRKQRDMAALEEATATLQSLQVGAGIKQDVFVPWKLQSQHQPKPSSAEGPSGDVRPPQVFQRYYHLFCKGELRQLVLEAARAELQSADLQRFQLDHEEMWEQGNWCIQAMFTPHTSMSTD